MKKIISALLLLGFVLTLTGLGYVVNAQVAIGSRSEEVKVIQEILKTDPNIYPEGYVTGYYGPLTSNAVKKLQKRCGLPETGVIDSDTEKCIYPVGYRVRVIYPNGGEVLDRSQIYAAKWEVIEPEVRIPEIEPYWARASIDLFRRVKAYCYPCPSGTECPPCPPEESIFVRHIATVNLFDQAYSGRITPDIPNGEDYVIRITIGEGVVPIWIQEKEVTPGAAVPIKPTEIWPVPPVPPRPATVWDESDGTFEITGEVTPICPTCPVCPNYQEVIAILEKMVAELQQAINLLKRTR